MLLQARIAGCVCLTGTFLFGDQAARHARVRQLPIAHALSLSPTATRLFGTQPAKAWTTLQRNLAPKWN